MITGDESGDEMPNMDPECHGVPQSWHDDPKSPYYDEPCPRCRRRQGAFEDGRCTPCGYVADTDLVVA